jgi:hypothetical protein
MMARGVRLLAACWCCALVQAGWLGFGRDKAKEPADGQPAAGFRAIGANQALGVSAFGLSLEVCACT